ncbi:MAG: hypothetical protein ACOYMF_06095 [Bacteroidales bacterium]
MNNVNEIISGTQVIKLPTVDDLYNENAVELLSKFNSLNIILNTEPKADWIKENNGIKYLPIERIEWLLTRVYIKHYPEVKQVQLIGNSVQVTVRLHVLNPVSNEWEWADGVGACPLQTDKGKGATDFQYLKNASVQMAAPAAKSYAIKDAADHFGKIFGRDLNRSTNPNYDILKGKFEDNENQNVEAAKRKLSDILRKVEDADYVMEISQHAVATEEVGAATAQYYELMCRKVEMDKGITI